MLLLALAIVPFWRTGVSGIFNRTDLDFPLYPTEKLNSLLFVWSHNAFTGVDNVLSNGLLHLPTHVIFAVLKYLGLSTALVERVYFVAIVALCGWGMYYLTSTIVRHKDQRVVRGASLSASFFYMINFYTFDRLYQGHYDHLMNMGIMPFTLGLFIRGFDASSKPGRTWIGFALIVALLCSILFASNYGLIVIAAIVLASYAAFRLVHSLLVSHDFSKLRNEFKYVSVAGVFTLLLSSWWIVPSMSIYASGGTIDVFTHGWSNYLSVLSSSTNLLHGLCLLPPLLAYHFPFNASWGVWFSSPLSIGISLGLAALGVAAAIFKKWKDPHVMFFMSLLLLSWGFSAGLNPPLGWAYSIVYNLLPFMRVLRDPRIFNQIVVLCLAILVGISIGEISRYILERNIIVGRIGRYFRPFSRRTDIVLSLVLLVVLIINLFPIASGDLQGSLSPFKPPDYYNEAREWLQQQDEDFRILMVPQAGWYERYSWFQNYDMVPLPMNVFPKPVIDDYLGEWPQSPSSLSLDRYTLDALSSGKQAEFEIGLALLNVKYVCVREDLLYPASISVEPKEIGTSQIQATLSCFGSLHLEKTFGQLLFYKNDLWRPLQIYTATNVTLVNDNVNSIFNMLHVEHFTVGGSVLLDSEQVSSSQAQFVQEHTDDSYNSSPVISFEKVNPTKYRVNVSGATGPFFLAFSESYHTQWKAYLDFKNNDTNWIEAFYRRSITSGNHFMVNGYANAWYIDPAELGAGEEFSITLYYQPQSLFYLGLIISGLTFVGCIILLLWVWTRGRKLKAKVELIISKSHELQRKI